MLLRLLYVNMSLPGAIIGFTLVSGGSSCVVWSKHKNGQFAAALFIW
jgi:hypothetical protein